MVDLGGYVIILSAILGSYFRGQSVPQFMVSVLSLKSTDPLRAIFFGKEGVSTLDSGGLLLKCTQIVSLLKCPCKFFY